MAERASTKHDIQHDELDQTRQGFSAIARVFVTGSIGLVSTGVDSGTGDVTLYVTGSSSGASSIFVQDDGIPKGSVGTVNFVGNGVDVSVSGTVARVNISGVTPGHVIYDVNENPFPQLQRLQFNTGLVVGSDPDNFRTLIAVNFPGEPTYNNGNFIATGTQTHFDGNVNVVASGTVIYASFSNPTGAFLPYNGWIPAPFTWGCHRIADAPIYDININANITGTIGVGDRIWGVQGGANKFFLVHGVAITGSTSYLNLYGGTDYTIITGAITSPQYSNIKAPFGFPLDPLKWTVKVSDTGNCIKSTPSGTVWYGDTGLSATGPSISFPLGAWNASYKAMVSSRDTTVTDFTVYITLSTSPTTESDSEWTAGAVLSAPAGTYDVFGAIFVQKSIFLTAKTTHYLNIKSNISTADNIKIRGDIVTTIIRAVSNYL